MVPGLSDSRTFVRTKSCLHGHIWSPKPGLLRGNSRIVSPSAIRDSAGTMGAMEQQFRKTQILFRQAKSKVFLPEKLTVVEAAAWIQVILKRTWNVKRGFNSEANSSDLLQLKVSVLILMDRIQDLLYKERFLGGWGRSQVWSFPATLYFYKSPWQQLFQ